MIVWRCDECKKEKPLERGKSHEKAPGWVVYGWGISMEAHFCSESCFTKFRKSVTPGDYVV